MPEYLYVIRTADGVRKLGRSRDPLQRMNQLHREVPTDSRDGLTLEHQVECPAEHIARAETYAQYLVRDWLYKGEWFQVDADTARQAVDAAAAIAARGGDFPIPKPVRMCVLMTTSMRDEIKEWRFSHYVETEGEAIRQLLRLGLAAEGIDPP
jgi:hypothetical protein